MPQFSVIIPTFNRAAYVGLAIGSVLQQTFRDFEIIVIDDGSDDNTADVVAALQGPIKYFHQTNQGVSSARNRGIREATGDWISFLDSDDEWEPHYLARQAELASKYPSIVSSSLNSVEYGRDGTTINKFSENGLFGPARMHREIVFDAPLDMVIRHDITILDSCVFRRENLMRTRLFDESLTIAEDFDVVMQMAQQGPFAFSAEVGTRIFRREESMPSLSSQLYRKGLLARQSWARVLERALQSPNITEHQKGELRFRYSRNQRSLGNLLLRTGQTAKAREAYRHALMLWPSLGPRVRLVLSYLPFEMGTLFLYSDKNVQPKWEQDEVRSKNSRSPIP